MRTCRTWAICQEKGGVGKTILTLNLGTYAASRGEKVLIVDLDAQNSAVFWNKTREDAGAANGGPSVMGVSPERLPDMVKLAAELEGTLVLIDTPSRLDSVAVSAIRQADLILCPTVPGLLSLAPLQKTVELIKGADKLSSTVGVLNNVEQGAGVEHEPHPTPAGARETLPKSALKFHHASKSHRRLPARGVDPQKNRHHRERHRQFV
jgi:cellulose biosynthesis protein BcsQ